jgi:hypothetical protein
VRGRKQEVRRDVGKLSLSPIMIVNGSTFNTVRPNYIRMKCYPGTLATFTTTTTLPRTTMTTAVNVPAYLNLGVGEAVAV